MPVKQVEPVSSPCVKARGYAYNLKISTMTLKLIELKKVKQ
jgi:hypothetical protein